MAKRKERKTKYFRTRSQFIKFLKDIPNILTGKLPHKNTHSNRIYNAFWGAVQREFFVQLYEAYDRKSNFLPDDNGDLWHTLSSHTRAYKRRNDRTKLLTPQQKRKLKNPNTLGMLSPSQFKLWQKTFAKVFTKEKKKQLGQGKAYPATKLSPSKYKKFRKTAPINEPSGSTDEEIKAKAAAIAWATVKGRGGETLIGTLGKRPMPIMKNTGLLHASLRPGKISNLRYIKGHKNQVSRVAKGVCYIGTSVSYANFASRTIKRKEGFTIKREFLPEQLGVFHDRAMAKGSEAVQSEIAKLIEENNKLK
jgi:hypothetical protein